MNDLFHVRALWDIIRQEVVGPRNHASVPDKPWMVYGNTQVYGDAQVSGTAQVHDDAWVFGFAEDSK